MITLRKLTYIFLISLLGLVANAAEVTDEARPDKSEYQAYLTADTNSNVPAHDGNDDFSCSDKIYAVIEASNLTGKMHVLEVRWIGPSGNIQERTHYEFAFHGDNTRIWAWLSLYGPTGAVIGRLFDPSFGMGEFIGEWEAEILVDKKQIASLPFHILC